MDKKWIEARLLEARNDLDVRTDQCDVVRVGFGRTIVGITYLSDVGEYEATAQRFSEEVDFWQEELWSATAPTKEDIVEGVLGFFARESGAA